MLSVVVYTLPLAYNALVTPFFHVIPSQDVVSASLAPVSVLTRGNFYLDQYRKYIANNYPAPYFVAEVNGHMVARTTVVSGVLALPLMGLGLGSGWIARTVNVFDVARLAAGVLTALGALAFFFAARTLTDTSTSVLVTVAFAFGSSVWTTASEGLWQHTPSILFLCIALYFLARAEQGTRALAPAGLFLSLATISRPPDLATAMVMTLFVFVHHRRSLIPFIVGALPPLVLALAYNTTANGSPLVFGYQDGVVSYFGWPQLESFQGLLFSPSRGLFVFSPFLLLMPVGLGFALRERKYLYAYLARAFVAYTTIMAAWGSLGGWAYGPRMLTDTLPLACLLIIPVGEKTRGAWRGAVWVVVLFAAFVSSLGVWDYGVRFHGDGNSVWSIENNEPLFYLRLYISMIQEFFSS